MSSFKDLTGRRYNKITVLKPTEKRGHSGSVVWECLCECGNQFEAEGGRIKYMKSCGCLSRQASTTFGARQTKHSESSTRLYNIWSKMKTRCCNPKDKRYKDYGGRGIHMCDQWLNSYKEFAKWAKSNGYKDNLTIDRIDNNGNYTPENCKWSTSKEQALNKRSNRVMTYNGKTMTLKEWAEELHIPYGCLQTRMIRGWTEEETLTTPIQQHRKKVE